MGKATFTRDPRTGEVIPKAGGLQIRKDREREFHNQGYAKGHKAGRLIGVEEALEEFKAALVNWIETAKHKGHPSDLSTAVEENYRLVKENFLGRNGPDSD